MASIITGVDIGGTFTDLIYIDDATGATGVAKVSSTPDDPARALLNALRESGLGLDAIAVIVHGTTVATNTVLQRRGAKCGLLTTEGFRDVLEFRRRDRPHTYGLTGVYEPLIPRDRCLEVRERLDYAGEVVTPLREEDVRKAAEQLLAKGVEAVVVSFLHSYANPTHERRARELLTEVWPNRYIVLGSDVLPEYREFERTSTAVVNAYVQPTIEGYLSSLVDKLRRDGYQRDVVIVQSNGGIMSLDVARGESVNTLLSGPAAGVIAAARLSTVAGYPNSITCDMGGTSFDVCLISDGKPSMRSSIELEYAVPINVPMIDINTIGAGGGSIAWIDEGGILRIGPQSAGADPGPVCYHRGGDQPTVTDANLVLGRINPSYSIGGEEGFTLDVERARAALHDSIAKPLGLSDIESANAVLQVANNKMAGSIRMVSIERGHDPRDFTLVAFGGAGPLHAVALMQELGIARALIPLFPGVTSAMGCTMANVRHDFVQTLNRRLDDLDLGHVREIFAGHADQGKQIIAEEGIPVATVEVVFEADMAYDGQTHVVLTTFENADVDHDAIRRTFEETYQRFYGRIIEGFPVTIVNLRTTIEGMRPSFDLRRFLPGAAATLEEARKGERQVYFDGSFMPADIYERNLLPVGVSFTGPAIVEQADATTVIPPSVGARVDDIGNLVLERQT